MDVTAPESLKREHAELHAELVAATKAGGKIGEAAQAVAKTLHKHFEKEEQYALPPLGLLTMLSEGKLPHDIPAIVAMTEKLKTDLSLMLHEHKAIAGALHKLMDIAEDARKPEYVTFAEKMKLHAQTEEEVLYPAAILIGEYLKLKR